MSDGEDTTGNSLNSILEGMKVIDNKLIEKGINYTITTFGFGSNHDEKVLSGISNYKNGEFYYIMNNSLVD